MRDLVAEITFANGSKKRFDLQASVRPGETVDKTKDRDGVSVKVFYKDNDGSPQCNERVFPSRVTAALAPFW